jgi:TP901 family phage tail tape measure protein
MSDATTDILLRIRVEVNNLSSMANLEKATQSLEQARLKTAKTAAITAAAEERLNQTKARGQIVAKQQETAAKMFERAEKAVATALKNDEAAQLRLNNAKKAGDVLSKRYIAADNAAKKSAETLATAKENLKKAIIAVSTAETRGKTAAAQLTKAESQVRIAATGEATALARLSTAQSQATMAADRARAMSDRLRAAKDKESAAWMASARKLNLFGRALGGLFGNLTTVERKLDAIFRAASHMQTMGRQMIGFAQRVGAAITDMVSKWGDFEFMLNRATAASGLFTAGAPLYDKMKRAILDAAQALRLFDPEEIAKATYFWQSTTGEAIKTEADLARMMKNVSAAMQVAAMTQTEYETVIKGGYSIMKQYGMALEDIPTILHSLFKETQATALEFPDLIESFKMTGPLAHALGISFEEVSVTLGLLGDLGIRGSQAGRGLGMFLTQMVRPAPKGIKAMNALLAATMGVSNGYKKLVFPKGKFIGMEKFVTLLAQATKGLTDQQKLNYITSIVGTQNAARVIIPLINAQIEAVKKGTSIYKDSKYSFANATQSFQDSWAMLAESWNGIVGAIKQTLLPILLTIGEVIAKTLSPVLTEFTGLLNDMRPVFEEVAATVADALQPVIKWFQSMVRQVSNWIKNNPKLVKQIAVWAAFGSVIIAVVGAVLLLLGTLAFLVSNLILVGAGVLPIVAVLGTMAYALMSNMGGITDAFSKMWDALKRVFGIMLGGGKDAAASWDDLITKGKELLTDVLTKVADAISAVADWLNSLSPEQVKTLKDIIVTLIGLKVLDTVLGLAIAFVSLFKNIGLVLGWLATSIFPVLFRAGQLLFGGLRVLIAGLIPVVQVVIGFLVLLASALGVPVWAAGALVAAIVAVIAAIVAFIFNIGGFRDFVISVFNNIMTFIGEAIGAIGRWLGEVFQNIVAVLTDAFNAFVGWLSSIPGAVAEFIGTIVAAVGGFIGTIIKAIVDFLVDLSQNWGKYLGQIVGFVIAWIVRIIAEVGIFLYKLASSILEFLTALPGHFLKWLQEAANNITNWINDTIDAVVKWAGDFLMTVANLLIALPGQVAGWLSDVFDALSKWFVDTAISVSQWASDMIEGILNWFAGLPARIVDAILGLGKMLSDFFYGLLDGSGDLMKSLGDVAWGIVQGIWEGIKSLGGYLAKQIGDFFSGIVDGVKKTLGIQSPSKVFAEIGKNMIAGLAVGIDRSDAAVTAMAKATTAVLGAAQTGLAPFSTEIASLSGGFNYTKTTESTKSIDLNVNVTSGDGSVNSVDMATLANLITGSEMVRALEQMATVN